jgi:DeoR/GlpR family transcriptional regulator of sugar metabolism
MKRKKALVVKRRNEIMEMIHRNPILPVDHLAETFGVSKMTIRRDIKFLKTDTNITYAHGNVLGILNGEDELLMYRTKIAQCAAQFVEDNDTVFLNTGRNALMILKYIKGKNVTVITNNGRAIGAERSDEVNVILTGGELRYPKNTMVGDFALRNLQPIYAKKAFISCFGINAENGVSTEIANEVNINEIMINHTTKAVFVLADHTKIGKNSSFISGPIGKITYLITDEQASEEELEKIRSFGVHVYKVT